MLRKLWCLLIGHVGMQRRDYLNLPYHRYTNECRFCGWSETWECEVLISEMKRGQSYGHRYRRTE